MLRDQFRLKRELQRLRSAKLADKDNQAALESLREKLDRSIAKRRSREENLPETNIDSTLPIFERRDEIIETIQKNQVVIISGETGSGKSTQLPLMCLQAGFGTGGIIGHTQPRRIAARGVASRIAHQIKRPLVWSLFPTIPRFFLPVNVWRSLTNMIVLVSSDIIHFIGGDVN